MSIDMNVFWLRAARDGAADRSGPYAGKVCVITGAASGLGLALASALARRGAVLELWDLNEVGLKEASSALNDSSNSCTTVVDVGDWRAVSAAARAVVQRRARVDYVFNNAAVALCANVGSARLDEYEAVIRTNLLGVIHGSKAFLPILCAQRSGHIVNVSSVFASVATPSQSAYCATKAAVSGFTHCMAREAEGDGVRVSLVIPGGLSTNLAKSARMGADSGPREIETRSRLGRRMRGDPRKAAQRILKGVARGRRRIFATLDAAVLDLAVRIAPIAHERLLRSLLDL